MNQIVVGVDRSETARVAALRAASLASCYDGTLTVLMCVDKRGHHLATGGGALSAKAAENQQYLNELCASLPHDRVRNTIATGDPAEVLCDEAARLDAQLIVVGNHRAHGVAGILGSVAGDVVKHAPCDVLIANTTS